MLWYLVEFQGKIRPSKNADVEAMSIYSPDGGISHVLIDQDSRFLKSIIVQNTQAFLVAYCNIYFFSHFTKKRLNKLL